jgi:hypothetical protein
LVYRISLILTYFYKWWLGFLIVPSYDGNLIESIIVCNDAKGLDLPYLPFLDWMWKSDCWFFKILKPLIEKYSNSNIFRKLCYLNLCVTVLNLWV